MEKKDVGYFNFVYVNCCVLHQIYAQGGESAIATRHACG